MFKYLEGRSYENYNQHVLSQLAKGNESFLQRMSILQTLDIHRGCVNSVIWDDAGEYILSGSDDQQLIISKPWNGKTVRKLRTSHRANIFSAKFIPYSSNNQIISCSGDGILIYTDLNQCDETYDCRFTCHVGTSYDVITVPSDPYSFLSCGEDGTVRWFDLRIKTSCLAHECKEDILLNMGKPVTAIGINPLAHFQLAVATQDSTIHIFDRRMLGTKAHDSYLSESNKAVLMRLKPQSLEGKKHRVTSLRYSDKGDQVLASYSSDYLYLFDTKNFKEVPLEGACGDDICQESDSEPTLKRLRLRGDWSDTGPQAVPQGEMASQAEDVGQARPTLQSTLMQRMTDILSRMLHAPSQRGAAGGTRRPAGTTEDGERNAGVEDEGGASLGEVASEEGSAPPEREPSSSSAPPSIASPTAATSDTSFNAQPRLSDPSVAPPADVTLGTPTHDEEPSQPEPMSLSESPTVARKEPSPETSSSAKPLTPSLSQLRMSLDNLQEHWILENISGEEGGSEKGAESRPEEKVESESAKNETQTENPSNSEPEERSVLGAESIQPSSCSNENVPEAVNPSSDARESESPSSSNRRMSRERSSSGNQEANSETSSGGSHRNCRMAKLVDRVMQRKRAENANRSDGDSDRFVPYGRELQQYRGHRNARTMIKEACFWGDNHVMSGSDCGRVFVWEKQTGKLVMLWEADRHVVNCLQPHPTLPVLATSGIDYDVKLWAPIRPEACFDEEKATEIAKRNEMLLAETRDTVTVPATFMIRMLATLNQLRHDRMRNRSQNNDDDDDEDDEDDDD